MPEDGHVGRGRLLLPRGGRLIAHDPKFPGNFGAWGPSKSVSKISGKFWKSVSKISGKFWKPKFPGNFGNGYKKIYYLITTIIIAHDPKFPGNFGAWAPLYSAPKFPGNFGNQFPKFPGNFGAEERRRPVTQNFWKI